MIGVVSQSSLLVLEHSKFGVPTHANPSSFVRLQQSSSQKGNYRFVVSSGKHLKPIFAARVVSSGLESSTLVTDNVDLSTEGIEIEPDSGGGDDGYGDTGGRGGGGGGGDNSGGQGGGGGDDQSNEGEGGSSEGSGGEKRKMALSMSQKLTLGYAALVGSKSLLPLLVEFFKT